MATKRKAKFPWFGLGLALGAVGLYFAVRPKDAASAPPPGPPPAGGPPPQPLPDLPPWPDHAAVIKGHTLAVVVLGDDAALSLGAALAPMLTPMGVATIPFAGQAGTFSSAEDDLRSKLGALASSLPPNPGSKTWLLVFSDDIDYVAFSRFLAEQGYVKQGDAVIVVDAVTSGNSVELGAWNVEVQNSNAARSSVDRGTILVQSDAPAEAFAALTNPMGLPR